MSALSARLDKVISAGLILVIVFTALAHGAVEPWSRALFCLAILLLGTLWVFESVAEKSLVIRVPVIVWPMLALLLLGLAQSVAVTDAQGVRRSISRDVEATRLVVTTFFFLILACLLAARFLASSPERLKRVMKFLAIYGFGMALLGLAQHFTGEGYYYWLRPVARGEIPFGPFANHNHFAGYMELLIPMGIALALSQNIRAEERVLYAVAAVTMAVAGILTLSRGGMISILAQLLFMLAVGFKQSPYPDDGWSRSRRWIRTAALLAIIGAVAGGIVWIGAEPVLNRVVTVKDGSSDSGGEFFISRGQFWKDTWTMIQASPILGMGLGAFETAYPAFSSDRGDEVLSEAHNDYLQVLADTGIVGGTLAIWFLLTLCLATGRLLNAKDARLQAVGSGLGGGVFGLMIHSLFDFNLQILSNALLFLVLAAIISTVAATVPVALRARVRLPRQEADPAASTLLPGETR